jgi:hypothetical protein
VHTAYFPQQTAFAYGFYVTFSIMLFAIVAAYASMIRKSGFSSLWILLPGIDAILLLVLVSLLFFVPVTYTFGSTTLTTPATLDTYKVLAILTFVLGVASFIGFFVFAFSTWPIEREVFALRHRAREASGEALLRSAPSLTIPPPGAPAPRAVRGPIGATGAAATALLVAAPPTPQEPATIFCSWCGKERRCDALSIHHCGSTTRPPVYCSSCGGDLAADAVRCERCGTPSSTLSSL